MTFREGDCIKHRSSGRPSIVIGRSMTARGRELYHLRQIELGEHRFHWMLGDVLVPMTGEEAACVSCRCKRVCPMRA